MTYLSFETAGYPFGSVSGGSLLVERPDLDSVVAPCRGQGPVAVADLGNLPALRILNTGVGRLFRLSFIEGTARNRAIDIMVRE